MTTKRGRKAPAKRREVPPPENVIEELTFVSPKGNRYTILRTTEVDEYEEKPAKRKKKSGAAGS